MGVPKLFSPKFKLFSVFTRQIMLLIIIIVEAETISSFWGNSMDEFFLLTLRNGEKYEGFVTHVFYAFS